MRLLPRDNVPISDFLSLHRDHDYVVKPFVVQVRPLPTDIVSSSLDDRRFRLGQTPSDRFVRDEARPRPSEFRRKTNVAW